MVRKYLDSFWKGFTLVLKKILLALWSWYLGIKFILKAEISTIEVYDSKFVAKLARYGPTTLSLFL